MIAALDAHYAAGSDGVESAFVGGVAFRTWTASEPVATRRIATGPSAPYQTGAFYRRELPALLAWLAAWRAEGGALLNTVVVDGHVWLGPGRPGLGAHLRRSLEDRLVVVGVAKTPFAGADAVARPVRRGVSAKPLWVTADGLDADAAARAVASMRGPHRLPMLLKRADQLARGVWPA